MTDTGRAGNIGSWAAEHEFAASYSEQLQQGDDSKIPVRSKSVPGYYNQLAVVLQVAQTGVDTDFTCYKNGVEIDTITVPDGDTTATLDIDRTFVDVDDEISWAITWSGEPVTYGHTATMSLRLSV